MCLVLHAQCVQDLFDGYADIFDHCLVDRLEYKVPSLLRKQIQPHRFSRCLDLGCGTGLCGVAFRNCCDYLEGVDISNRMIEKARLRGIYDTLVHDDVVAYLRTQPDNSFDLLICADVLIYIWDVEMLFNEAIRVTTPNGIFAFSTESTKAGVEVVETASERFAHSRKYIMRLALDSSAAFLSPHCPSQAPPSSQLDPSPAPSCSPSSLSLSPSFEGTSSSHCFDLQSVENVILRQEGSGAIQGDTFVFRKQVRLVLE